MTSLADMVAYDPNWCLITAKCGRAQLLLFLEEKAERQCFVCVRDGVSNLRLSFLVVSNLRLSF